jgi:hypothetical protein
MVRPYPHRRLLIPPDREEAVTDGFADRLFARVDAAVARVAELPPDELVGALRPEVREVLISFGDDGSWPETELLQEALRAFVDFADATVDWSDLPPEDQRWLDACRQCTVSTQLLDDMLASLRPEIGRAGYSGR